MKAKYSVAIALALVALVVGMRLLPHPDNFAPLTAIAIFAGAVLPRKLTIWTPLAAAVISDLIIGLYDTVLFTWTCYAAIAFVSSQYLRRPNVARGVVLTVASSVFFFLVTNFATWLVSGMYAHTWRGLSECFVLALPFFRGTAASDVMYTAALFAAYGAAAYVLRRRTTRLDTRNV